MARKLWVWNKEWFLSNVAKREVFSTMDYQTGEEKNEVKGSFWQLDLKVDWPGFACQWTGVKKRLSTSFPFVPSYHTLVVGRGGSKSVSAWPCMSSTSTFTQRRRNSTICSWVLVLAAPTAVPWGKAVPEGYHCRATQWLNYARICVCLFSIECVQLSIGFSTKDHDQGMYLEFVVSPESLSNKILVKNKEIKEHKREPERGCWSAQNSFCSLIFRGAIGLAMDRSSEPGCAEQAGGIWITRGGVALGCIKQHSCMLCGAI